MDEYTRRRFLAAGTALAGGVGLAGCLGGGSGAETTESGLHLDTLSVGGSPGDRIAVQPSGTVVLLDFFATWCAPCKPQMDNLRTVREEASDVHMLSITWEDDRDAVESFWQEYEGTWPVAMDPEVRTGEEYDVNNLPTLLIFTPDGTESWRHVGLADTETILSEIDAAR